MALKYIKVIKFNGNQLVRSYLYLPYFFSRNSRGNFAVLLRGGAAASHDSQVSTRPAGGASFQVDSLGLEASSDLDDVVLFIGFNMFQ
jgi:hypothetical protein